MNDTEKTVRILRIISYLLCAILLMEVILFAGITAFASVENYFIPSEAHLNQRINSSGSLASFNGLFTTNIFYIPSDVEYIYIKGIEADSLSPWYEIGNVRVGFGSTDSFPLGNARYLYNANNSTSLGVSFVDGTTDVTRIATVYGTDRDLRGKYVAFTLAIPNVTNVSLSDVENIIINFTGDFSVSVDSPSVFDMWQGMINNIPSITSNLISLFYNNGLTMLGMGLISVCGFGCSVAVITFIFKSLRRGG